MKKGCWWAVFGIGFAALVAGNYALTHWWDYGIASDELPDAIRAYRAAGLPWTAEELNGPPIPEKENAAPLVKKLIAGLNKSLLSDFDKEYRLGTASRLLPKFSKILAQTHEIAAKRSLDFQRDWDLGPNLLFPEPSYIKRLCKVLAVRAEIRTAHQDDSGALSDLEDSRRLAGLMGQEPSLYAAETSAAAHRTILAGAIRCLAIVGRDEHRIRKYQNWLQQPSERPNSRRWLQGDIYLSVVLARSLDLFGTGQEFLPTSDERPFLIVDDPAERSDHAPVIPRPRRNGLPLNSRSRGYLTRCLQEWTELANRTHGLTDSPALIAQVHEAIFDRHADSRRLSEGQISVLFGAIGNSKINDSIAAYQTVALSFSNALIVRAQTDKWPSRIAVPDPVGHGALHTRVSGERIRIWSVGKNGRDDSGLVAREAIALGKSSDDIVAAYPPIR